MFAYNQTAGRILGKKELLDKPLVETSNLTEEEAAIQNATAPNLNGEARKRKAMAEGKVAICTQTLQRAVALQNLASMFGDR